MSDRDIERRVRGAFADAEPDDALVAGARLAATGALAVTSAPVPSAAAGPPRPAVGRTVASPRRGRC